MLPPDRWLSDVAHANGVDVGIRRASQNLRVVGLLLLSQGRTHETLAIQSPEERALWEYYHRPLDAYTGRASTVYRAAIPQQVFVLERLGRPALVRASRATAPGSRR